MTMVVNLQNPLASGLTFGGGTLVFMAPELLAPSIVGLKNAIPTQEGDIYAFGLVIFRVFMLCRCYLVIFPDVLAGPNRRSAIS